MKNDRLEEWSSLHRHVLDWLRANGIDPDVIPTEPTMTFDGERVTTDVYMLGDKGQRVLAPGRDALQRTVATYDVTVPPPPDVAEWLRPRCSECGR